MWRARKSMRETTDLPLARQRRAQKNWLGRDGLQRLFGAGSHLVVAGFKLIMTLAQLGLDFFGHQINGRVEIALCIPGNYILPRQRQFHGAGVLLFGHTFVVTLQIDKCLQRVGFLMIQFIDAQAYVFIQAVSKSDLVGRQDQFHTPQRSTKAGDRQRAGDKNHSLIHNPQTCGGPQIRHEDWQTFDPESPGLRDKLPRSCAAAGQFPVR